MNWRLISRRADLVLLEKESRTKALFSPANFLVGMTLVAGGGICYFLNVFVAAAVSILIVPMILYWEARSIAQRVRKAGVLDDLEATVHGRTMIARHFEEFCNHFASRGLFGVIFVYLCALLFEKHIILAILGFALTVAIAAPLYFDAARTGKNHGLIIEGQTRVAPAVFRTVASVVIFIGYAAIIFFPLLWAVIYFS